MINARGFGKGSAIRAFDLRNQTFRFEAGGLGGTRLGALRGQGGLEGQRSDGERYRLDGAGRERITEGSREVSRQNLVPGDLAGACGQELCGGTGAAQAVPGSA